MVSVMPWAKQVCYARFFHPAALLDASRTAPHHCPGRSQCIVRSERRVQHSHVRHWLTALITAPCRPHSSDC